ncbi:hypothetical protein HOY80DRAFT_872513, partial [Tuber brumale]
PENIKNDCTKDESDGFDWNDLPTGSFSKYKDYSFSGWSCKTKPGKRGLEGRTFNSKCIEANVKKDDFSNEISCDKSFSIGEIDVSVDDDDTEVEFHYGMPDGSTCKKVSKCSKDGNTIKNDQCGGARTVKVKLPNNSNRGSCNIGFHKIKFECNTSTTSVPVPTTTIPSCNGPNCCSGKPCPTTTSFACVPGKGKDCPGSTTSAPVTSTTSACVPGKGKDCPPCDGKDCPGTTTSAPCNGSNCPGSTTSSPHASSSCVPGKGKDCPSSTVIVPPGSTSVPCYGSDCPGTTTSSPHASTSCVPGKGKDCPSSTAIGSVSVSSPPPAATTPAAPLPPTECPPTLPRCLKTWLFIIDCDDTADASCFCPHGEFVTKVSECVQSWGKDDADVSKSLEYFLGICQPYIPQNPAIVTCLPPTITLPPPPANVPVTTVVQTIATVVPCPVTTITAGPSSGSVVSTTTTTKTLTVTIPLVKLIVTTTDAVLVYPTLPATAVPTTKPPTGPGST